MIIWPQKISAEDQDRDGRRWIWTYFQARQRLTLAIALITVSTFIGLNVSRQIDIDQVWLTINIIQLISLLLITLLLLHRGSRQKQALTFILISASLTLPSIFVNLAVGNIIKLEVATWTLVFLTQATLIPFRWQLHLLSQLVVVVALMIAHLLAPDGYELIFPFGDMYFSCLYLFWFWLICDLSVYFHEKLQYSELSNKFKLKREKQRSRQLLLNMLPETIAKRLENGEELIADSYDDVSIMFADIVGFTKLAGKMTPEKLIELLNNLFSKLDELLAHHGIEKIKTIGDAYMVAAGLPIVTPDHTRRIARYALATREALYDFNQQHDLHLEMRIGIHSGPVVAGVIGKERFSYDIWGDAVNIASRMESNSLAGKIQVSENVYQRLKECCEFDSRGDIQFKGKGFMPAYILKGFLPDRTNPDQDFCPVTLPGHK